MKSQPMTSYYFTRRESQGPSYRTRRFAERRPASKVAAGPRDRSVVEKTNSSSDLRSASNIRRALRKGRDRKSRRQRSAKSISERTHQPSGPAVQNIRKELLEDAVQHRETTVSLRPEFHPPESEADIENDRGSPSLSYIDSDPMEGRLLCEHCSELFFGRTQLQLHISSVHSHTMVENEYFNGEMNIPEVENGSGNSSSKPFPCSDARSDTEPSQFSTSSSTTPGTEDSFFYPEMPSNKLKSCIICNRKDYPHGRNKYSDDDEKCAICGRRIHYECLWRRVRENKILGPNESGVWYCPKCTPNPPIETTFYPHVIPKGITPGVELFATLEFEQPTVQGPFLVPRIIDARRTDFDDILLEKGEDFNPQMLLKILYTRGFYYIHDPDSEIFQHDCWYSDLTTDFCDIHARREGLENNCLISCVTCPNRWHMNCRRFSSCNYRLSLFEDYWHCDECIAVAIAAGQRGNINEEGIYKGQHMVYCKECGHFNTPCTCRRCKTGACRCEDEHHDCKMKEFTGYHGQELSKIDARKNCCSCHVMMHELCISQLKSKGELLANGLWKCPSCTKKVGSSVPMSERVSKNCGLCHDNCDACSRGQVCAKPRSCDQNAVREPLVECQKCKSAYFIECVCNMASVGQNLFIQEQNDSSSWLCYDCLNSQRTAVDSLPEPEQSSGSYQRTDGFADVTAHNSTTKSALTNNLHSLVPAEVSQSIVCSSENENTTTTQQPVAQASSIVEEEFTSTFRTDIAHRLQEAAMHGLHAMLPSSTSESDITADFHQTTANPLPEPSTVESYAASGPIIPGSLSTRGSVEVDDLTTWSSKPLEGTAPQYLSQLDFDSQREEETHAEVCVYYLSTQLTPALTLDATTYQLSESGDPLRHLMIMKWLAFHKVYRVALYKKEACLLRRRLGFDDVHLSNPQFYRFKVSSLLQQRIVQFQKLDILRVFRKDRIDEIVEYHPSIEAWLKKDWDGKWEGKTYTWPISYERRSQLLSPSSEEQIAEENFPSHIFSGVLRESWNLSNSSIEGSETGICAPTQLEGAPIPVQNGDTGTSPRPASVQGMSQLFLNETEPPERAYSVTPNTTHSFHQSRNDGLSSSDSQTRTLITEESVYSASTHPELKRATVDGDFPQQKRFRLDNNSERIQEHQAQAAENEPQSAIMISEDARDETGNEIAHMHCNDPFPQQPARIPSVSSLSRDTATVDSTDLANALEREDPLLDSDTDSVEQRPRSVSPDLDYSNLESFCDTTRNISDVRHKQERARARLTKVKDSYEKKKKEYREYVVEYKKARMSTKQFLQQLKVSAPTPGGPSENASMADIRKLLAVADPKGMERIMAKKESYERDLKKKSDRRDQLEQLVRQLEDQEKYLESTQESNSFLTSISIANENLHSIWPDFEEDEEPLSATGVAEGDQNITGSSMRAVVENDVATNFERRQRSHISADSSTTPKNPSVSNNAAVPSMENIRSTSNVPPSEDHDRISLIPPAVDSQPQAGPVSAGPSQIDNHPHESRANWVTVEIPYLPRGSGPQQRVQFFKTTLPQPSKSKGRSESSNCVSPPRTSTEWTKERQAVEGNLSRTSSTVLSSEISSSNTIPEVQLSSISPNQQEQGHFWMPNRDFQLKTVEEISKAPADHIMASAVDNSPVYCSDVLSVLDLKSSTNANIIDRYLVELTSLLNHCANAPNKAVTIYNSAVLGPGVLKSLSVFQMIFCPVQTEPYHWALCILYPSRDLSAPGRVEFYDSTNIEPNIVTVHEILTRRLGFEYKPIQWKITKMRDSKIESRKADSPLFVLVNAKSIVLGHDTIKIDDIGSSVALRWQIVQELMENRIRPGFLEGQDKLYSRTTL